MSDLRLSGVVKESVVDGPGLRYVVFAQGCPHRCAGCHNEQTWAYEGGAPHKPETIISDMKRNPLLRGITISGGEPFLQSGAFAKLAKLAREAGYNVYTYTGYLYEDLAAMSKRDQNVKELLNHTDTLVDGPFIKERKSYDLAFRGSSNQRLIALDGGI